MAAPLTLNLDLRYLPRSRNLHKARCRNLHKARCRQLRYHNRGAFLLTVILPIQCPPAKLFSIWEKDGNLQIFSLISDNYTSLRKKDISCTLFRINWMDGSFLLNFSIFQVFNPTSRCGCLWTTRDCQDPHWEGGQCGYFYLLSFLVFGLSWANVDIFIIHSFIFWSFLN